MLGADFSHVRIIRNAHAAISARQIHAKAYTVGNKIIFGAGQFQPETSAGLSLLVHELAHVVQNQNAAQNAGQTASDTNSGSLIVMRDEPDSVPGADDIVVWHYINTALEDNDGSVWEAWGDLMDLRKARPDDPNAVAAEHYMTARFLSQSGFPSFIVADLTLAYGPMKDFLRDKVGLDPSFDDKPTTKSNALQMKFGVTGAFDGTWLSWFLD